MTIKSLLNRMSWLITNSGYRRYASNELLRLTGYDFVHWSRKAQDSAWHKFIEDHYSGSGILEISPGAYSPWSQYNNYEGVQYPEFDICKDTLNKKFEIIIANQVFEHLRHPYTAGENVRSMLIEDGYFLISTPFMVRIHGSPNDFTRWTPDGLRGLLEDCGFRDIQVNSWGNRSCVIKSLKDWPNFGWGKDMRNEHQYPINVWAFARR